MNWMYWTVPTAIFFAVIAVILIGMTLWQVAAPSPERRGLLPLSTTPGDRLFIGLLSSAYFHLLWLGLTDFHPGWMTAFSALWLIALMRWG